MQLTIKVNDFDYGYRQEQDVRFLQGAEVDVIKIDHRILLAVLNYIVAPVLFFLLDKMPETAILFNVTVRH
jgi:hypothetical protein